MEDIIERPRPVVEYKDGTWLAANGHLMDGRYRRVDGGEWRSEGFSAVHSSDCKCETGGADLEDFEPVEEEW